MSADHSPRPAGRSRPKLVADDQVGSSSKRPFDETTTLPSPLAVPLPAARLQIADSLCDRQFVIGDKDGPYPDISRFDLCRRRHATPPKAPLDARGSAEAGRRIPWLKTPRYSPRLRCSAITGRGTTAAARHRCCRARTVFSEEGPNRVGWLSTRRQGGGSHRIDPQSPPISPQTADAFVRLAPAGQHGRKEGAIDALALAEPALRREIVRA